MKAILIDPKEKTITEAEYDGDYKTIYKLIGADCFDCVRIDESETIFVDDEGLINGNGQRNGFFLASGAHPVLLAGKGLILATDEVGDSIATKLTVEQVKEFISFGYPAVSDVTHHVYFVREDGSRVRVE